MRVSKTKIMLSIGAMFLASSAIADIKIAVLGPYSNNTSTDFGLSIKEGAILAAAEINSKGGVLGQKIILVPYDDKANPAKGLEVAKSAVDKKVVAAVGSVNLGVVLKTLPVFQDAKIPYIITASAGGQTANQYAKEPINYIFRLASTDMAQAELLAKYVSDVDKHNKIAIFADDSAYGKSGVEYLTKALAERKKTPVIIERFPVGEVDFEEAAIRARASGADAVITWALGPEAAAVRVVINRVGWRIPLYGSWTLTSKLYLDNAGLLSSESEMPVTITHDSKNNVYKQFSTNYKLMHRKSTIPSIVAASQTYDSIYLLAMAIQQAGSTEGPKVVEAMENLKGRYDGVLTSYTSPWTKGDHELSKVKDLLKIGILKSDGLIYEDKTEK